MGTRCSWRGRGRMGRREGGRERKSRGPGGGKANRIG